MTLRYPGERTFKALVRRNDHDALLLALVRLGPKRVYAGLLGHARHHRFKDGWAAHAFKEIFGTWPRPQDRGQPTRPPVELEEWVSGRPRRKRRSAI
jgi:hypothetical protein